MLLAEVAAVVPVIERASPWTPELITALFASLAGLIGTLATVLAGLITLWHNQKAAIVEQRAVAVEQKAVNQDVGAKIDRVHTLVNAGDSARLEELAVALRKIATLTNLPGDLAAAAVAEENVRRKAIETQKAENRMDIATQTAAVVAQTAAAPGASKAPCP